DIPLVSTARVIGLNKLRYVAVDEYSATMKIFDYLFSMGHVNIGFISGPRQLYSANARLRAYKDALKNYGVPFDQNIVAYGDTSVESGRRAMKDLLYKGKKLTAVFTGADLMAIGARHAIEEMGLHVPEDISLVSTDATDILKCLDVPVTTTKQPTRQRGELAMGMLVDLIEGREVPNSIMLPMDIDVHTSHKTPKKKNR
ncbi:MAG: substrate-binding domain-containing protein, partial [Clostridiales bacterium]|nr:substrate-binding domain-containing protein [Clostridiales bacterium]